MNRDGDCWNIPYILKSDVMSAEERRKVLLKCSSEEFFQEYCFSIPYASPHPHTNVVPGLRGRLG
jgi:hypothetical protein